MDTLLENGQHAIKEKGMPEPINDIDEVLQQASIRLAVKKRSFPYDPELGSELYKLHKSTSEATQREAFSYAQEALQPIANLIVTSAECYFSSSDTLAVKVFLKYKDKTFNLEVI